MHQRYADRDWWSRE